MKATLLHGPCDGCRRRKMLFSAGHGVELCLDCTRAEQRAAGTKFVNQHGKASGQRNAFPGTRVGPLDAGQKARLCILAREGFERLHGRAPDSEDELAAWRREQQQQACGVASLRAAEQRHYNDLAAHFLDLKGASGQAFRRLMDPEAKCRRVALAVLRRELRGAGLAWGYAVTICRQKYGCEPEACPKADQVWTLVFDIRKRGQSRARHAARPRTEDLPF